MDFDGKKIYFYLMMEITQKKALKIILVVKINLQDRKSKILERKQKNMEVYKD